MGLKILHSADWHLDSPFASFSGAQRESLRAAQQQIPVKLARACREHHCDLVLLAGDLFDGIWTRQTLETVQDALASCQVPVLISPGNHDPWGPDCPWEEEWPDNVCIFPPGIAKLDLPELNCRIYGAGFDSMDCPSLLEGFHVEPGARYQIGLFHGDPTGASSNYNPVTASQVRNSGLSYLALGHIHRLGGLQVGNTVCGWPGCPMGRGWDEPGEKGYLLVDLDGEVQLQPVTLDTPRFQQLTVEIGEDPAADLEAVLPPVSEDFFRVTMTGYGEPDLRQLQRRFSSIPNLTLRDQTLDPVDIWDQAGEDSLRGVYFQRLKDAAELAEPEERQRILLAAEISRKLLEGREVVLP